MKTEELTMDLTIQISESDFMTLHYLADKLDMSISEVIRSFIPKIPALKSPESPELKSRSFKILEDFDKTRLSEIIDEMIEKKMAKTLAVEIESQLILSPHKRDNLTGTTEKRLLRWTHPARIDDRTKFASPRAKEICEILFGFVPERKE
jgi:hypothetical protein